MRAGSIALSVALVAAAEGGHKAIVCLCLEWGATDTAVGNAMSAAIEAGQHEIARFLEQF